MADTVAATSGFLEQMNRRAAQALRHFNTEAAVALAWQVLPLAQIAAEAGGDLDAQRSQDVALHNWLVVLDLLLQHLQDRPGLGRELLMAAFTTPFVRSRHLALSAFAEWAPPQRDNEMIATLRHAASGEYVDSVERHFQAVIASLDAVALAAPQG